MQNKTKAGARVSAAHAASFLRDQASKEAVIYRRVSSKKQTVDGDGLGSQETRCREFARLRGLTVIAVFDDDSSGKFIDRPGMSAMLEFIRARRPKRTVAIIDDISRLARGLTAHIELRAAISAAGGDLQSPSIEFGDSSDSRMVEHMLASVSQYQREKNAEQTLNRMKARLMGGYFVWQAPAGFKYRTVRGRGKMLARDGEAADVVQEALERYASGVLETQADVMRFLQNDARFPKDGTGIVRNRRVSELLT